VSSNACAVEAIQTMKTAARRSICAEKYAKGAEG
jgi:hypothetical protein